MIKRMNKITSLVLAAASAASIVPASTVLAADYKRVEAEEGTIYNAVAYKDGSLFVDGNIKDGENDGAYFVNGGKFNDLEDVDTGSVVEVYADKYLSVDGGDYYIDLSNGKVTDEDVKENAEDDAATALRRKVKSDNDGRYTDEAAASIPGRLTTIAGNKFAAPYYEAQYEYAEGKSYTVYTNENGSYIDADYNLGKIKVSTADNSYTIAKADDEKNVTVEVDGAESTIAQDANNIYRIATIKLTADAPITAVNGLTLSNDTDAFTTTGNSVTFKAIQKISKAQASGDIDGAKYAKTVTTTVLSDEKGRAVSTLDEKSLFNVVNGKLINYFEDSNEVDTQLFELKSTKGYYYVDVTDGDKEAVTKLDVDANGNLWRLYNGYVYKFDNVDSWDKVYKVDGSMDEISVYDDKNIVVWNEDDEVYSIISSKSDQENTEVKTGWVQNEDGSWNYLDSEGKKVTGWLQSPASGLWYFMDAEGKMMSNGWIKDNGTWYYLQESGAMKTGWLNDKGTWYYLQPSGAMKTGWLNDRGTWYYLQESGAMKTGWLKDNGTWYYLQSSGAMKTGWLNDNGTWYYFNTSGAMLSNTTVDGYRLGANGAWIK